MSVYFLFSSCVHTSHHVEKEESQKRYKTNSNEATKQFSNENKLGQEEFGPVNKVIMAMKSILYDY